MLFRVVWHSNDAALSKTFSHKRELTFHTWTGICNGGPPLFTYCCSLPYFIPSVLLFENKNVQSTRRMYVCARLYLSSQIKYVGRPKMSFVLIPMYCFVVPADNWTKFSWKFAQIVCKVKPTLIWQWVVAWARYHPFRRLIDFVILGGQSEIFAKRREIK